MPSDLGSLLRLIFILISGLATGCSMQAGVIQQRHWDLNEVIRQTTDEQLLLNLVRLRYDERPYFLQVSSITTSFSASSSLGLVGNFPEGGRDVFGVNSGFSYSETPTVTWAIPDSREFFGRLNAPLGADQLTTLVRSGYNIVDIFKLGVNRMNLVQNREYDARDGELRPHNYDQFIEVLSLIETLRREDVLDLAFSLSSSFGGASLPKERLDSRAIADGMPRNLYFIERPERPGVVEPRAMMSALFMRIRADTDQDPRVRRLRALLKLDPEKYSFPITNTSTASPEGLRTESSNLSTIFDASIKLRHIMLNNRSMMEILRFAAASVEVPVEDVRRGVVRPRSVELDDYLKVRYSKKQPVEAWLKVQHHGGWFYISETDLDARHSFAMVSALFSAVVGHVPGAKPVLTLPVN